MTFYLWKELIRPFNEHSGLIFKNLKSLFILVSIYITPMFTPTLKTNEILIQHVFQLQTDHLREEDKK